MIDTGTITPADRRSRDLQRAMRSLSADALLAVAACRCIGRRMDNDHRPVAEARHAAV